MSQDEQAYDLACNTAREFLRNSQLLGLDSADTMVALETALVISIMTVSIMQGNENHQRYCIEVLDVMTERCVERIGNVGVITI